jgi:hypothetical protein
VENNFFGGKPPDGKKPPVESKPPEGGEQAPAKVFSYRCVEACTYGKRYRKAGDVVYLSEKRELPHFELIS